MQLGYYPPVKAKYQSYSFIVLLVEIDWDGTGWIKGNGGQTGFYRVNYEPLQWDQLINQLDNDHQVSKLGLTELIELFLFVFRISL